MISIAAAPIGHVVMTEDVYLVVRGDRTLVGATSEDVGYAAGTTDAAVGWLRRRAVETCPVLADMPILEAWSGLRPATPDLLPLLGPDPDEPRLVYACGHSRNGILLAPITARLTAAAIIGAAADIPIGQFSIARFGQKRRCE